MKIFISADIEGVAGVVNAQQGSPGNPEYERARRLMTQEVNAAIAGAERTGPRGVAFHCGGIVEVQQWIAVMATMSGTLR